MQTAALQPVDRTEPREKPKDKPKAKENPAAADRFRAALKPQSRAQHKAALAKQSQLTQTRPGDNPAVTRAFPNVNPQMSKALRLGQNATPQTPAQMPGGQMPMSAQAAGAQTLADLKQLAAAQQQAAQQDATTNPADATAALATAAEPSPTALTQPQAAATAQAQALPQAGQAGPPAAVVNPALLQQVVEFAAVTRNADGQGEFRLGFQQQALGGARMKLTRVGPGRVALQFTGDGISDAEVQQLVASLKTRNVEVAEVEFV